MLNGVIAVQRRHRSSSAASFAGQPCAASLMTAALQPALDRALLAGLHPLMSRVAVSRRRVPGEPRRPHREATPADLPNSVGVMSTT